MIEQRVLRAIVEKNTRPYVELCNPEFLQLSDVYHLKSNYTIIVSKLCKVAFHNVSLCLAELSKYTHLYWYCILNVSANTITYSASGKNLPAYLKPHIPEMSSHLHQAPFTLFMKENKQYVISQEFLNELNKYYDNPDLMWALVEVSKDCKLVAYCAEYEELEEMAEQEEIASLSRIPLSFYLLSLIAVIMVYAMHQSTHSE